MAKANEPKTYEKFADEERVFAWSFANFQEQTPVDMVSPVVTVETVTAPALVAGTPQLDLTGKRVLCELTGGKSGSTYSIRCHIQTSLGAHLTVFGKLKILDPPTVP